MKLLFIFDASNVKSWLVHLYYFFVGAGWVALNVDRLGLILFIVVVSCKRCVPWIGNFWFESVYLCSGEKFSGTNHFVMADGDMIAFSGAESIRREWKDSFTEEKFKILAEFVPAHWMEFLYCQFSQDAYAMSFSLAFGGGLNSSMALPWPSWLIFQQGPHMGGILCSFGASGLCACGIQGLQRRQVVCGSQLVCKSCKASTVNPRFFLTGTASRGDPAPYNHSCICTAHVGCNAGIP